MSYISRVFAVCLSALALSACSLIFEGTHQDITINTTPPGAECTLSKDGKEVIGKVESTPGVARIEKSKYDLVIQCDKPGYQTAIIRNRSDVAGATTADVLGGVWFGPVGWAVDSATGADNKYDSVVNLTLLSATPNPPSN
jgi:hypothetical protein